MEKTFLELIVDVFPFPNIFIVHLFKLTIVDFVVQLSFLKMKILGIYTMICQK